jgi:uncharacterized OB-fold protein
VNAKSTEEVSITKIRPRIGRWELNEHNEVVLIGTHCSACGEVTFPEHRICVKCGSESTEETRINGPATLRNYTIVHQLPRGFTSPLVVGYGEFHDQLLILAPIVDVARDQLHEGMQLTLCVGVTRIDEDGEPMESYQFKPFEE